MQNELNQEQIDAMVRAARGGAGANTGIGAGTAVDTAVDTERAPRVELWDVRRAGQIGREQLQAITQLHEGFARSLTLALASYLRVVLTATLVSAEHLTFREFMQRVPEITYLAGCRLEPMGVSGALQIDLKVIFPILDLLLGGEGVGVAATREITEIEEQIVEGVARIILRELGTAWQAVNLQADFEQRIDAAEAHELLLGEEKVLSLSFEIALLEVRGGLNFAVPISVSHDLLRKISVERKDRRPRGRSEWREQLKSRLLDCSFTAELAATGLRAEVSELSRLSPGQVLTLHGSAADAASLLVAGVEMFRAAPARFEDTRAAQVMERMSDPTPAEIARPEKKL